VRTATASYKGHRFPVEIIDCCVWLYFRFSLSFREVEELMLARGVVLSYETIRRWCAKFGQAYANPKLSRCIGRFRWLSWGDRCGHTV
jgi:putative transposase